MTGWEYGDQQIDFPVEVHFRIICLAREEVKASVLGAAEELGVREEMREANTSAAGKYCSFHLSLVVESRERMEEIDVSFRGVDGVKMVL